MKNAPLRFSSRKGAPDFQILFIPPFQLTYSLKYGRIITSLVGMAHCDEVESVKNLTRYNAYFIFYSCFPVIFAILYKKHKTAMLSCIAVLFCSLWNWRHFLRMHRTIAECLTSALFSKAPSQWRDRSGFSPDSSIFSLSSAQPIFHTPSRYQTLFIL